MSENFTESQGGFYKELLNLLHRWQEEGDMDAPQALEGVQRALNEWLDEPVIVFEPDPSVIEGMEGFGDE